MDHWILSSVYAFIGLVTSFSLARHWLSQAARHDNLSGKWQITTTGRQVQLVRLHRDGVWLQACHERTREPDEERPHAQSVEPKL